MAKWGQGDPRWIVEERKDATNVNNWHWTDKDAKEWSKGKFQELFIGQKIENDAGTCEITGLSKTEGDAYVLHRRGKLCFVYDWAISGNWEGKLCDGVKKFTGKFDLFNFGEEYEPHEITMDVSSDKDTDEARKVKEIMRTQGLKVIHQQVGKYVTDLKEVYSQGIILPSKDTAASAETTVNNKENVVKKEMNKVVENSPSTSKKPSNDVGVRIPTNTITMKETFMCEASLLYRALTDQGMVSAYAGDSTVEATRGGRFVLLGGNVLGEFTELVDDKKVCMRWRMKSWPDEHYSTVTIELEQRGCETVLTMKQKGVPAGEVDRTQEGWKVNYWERMKLVFGIGTNIP